MFYLSVVTTNESENIQLERSQLIDFQGWVLCFRVPLYIINKNEDNGYVKLKVDHQFFIYYSFMNLYEQVCKTDTTLRFELNCIYSDSDLKLSTRIVDQEYNSSGEAQLFWTAADQQWVPTKAVE